MSGPSDAHGTKSAVGDVRLATILRHVTELRVETIVREDHPKRWSRLWWRRPHNSDVFCDPACSYNLTQPETSVRFAVVELLSNWQASTPVVLPAASDEFRDRRRIR